MEALQETLLFWSSFVREMVNKLEDKPWREAWLLQVLQQMLLQLPSLPLFLETLADQEDPAYNERTRRCSVLVRSHVESLIVRFISLMCQALTNPNQRQQNIEDYLEMHSAESFDEEFVIA